MFPSRTHLLFLKSLNYSLSRFAEKQWLIQERHINDLFESVVFDGARIDQETEILCQKCKLLTNLLFIELLKQYHIPESQWLEYIISVVFYGAYCCFWSLTAPDLHSVFIVLSLSYPIFFTLNEKEIIFCDPHCQVFKNKQQYIPLSGFTGLNLVSFQAPLNVKQQLKNSTLFS